MAAGLSAPPICQHPFPHPRAVRAETGPTHPNRAGQFALSAPGPGPLPPRDQPAAPARPGARRRAQRVSPRHLYHQGKPHLRPGARRRRSRQRRRQPLQLRPARDPQPAQACPRFCPARQHLLLRHVAAPTAINGPTPPSPPITSSANFAGWPRSYPCGGFGEPTATPLPPPPPASFGTTPWHMAKPSATMASSPPARAGPGKIPPARPPPIFSPAYRDLAAGSNAIAYACAPDVESLRPFLATNAPGLGPGRPGCRPRRPLHPAN